MFFLKVQKENSKSRSSFRPVPGGDAPLPGHDEPERCLSVSSTRSVSVGHLALGRHFVCYPSPPCYGPDKMHQFLNALGEIAICHRDLPAAAVGLDFDSKVHRETKGLEVVWKGGFLHLETKAEMGGVVKFK